MNLTFFLSSEDWNPLTGIRLFDRRIFKILKFSTGFSLFGKRPALTVDCDLTALARGH